MDYDRWYDADLIEELGDRWRKRVEADLESLEGLRRLIRTVKAKAELQDKSVHPVRVGDGTFGEIVYWLEEMESDMMTNG
tara:strand:- start:90 stop:329 length:240 start_codon:yes stop_codon:yes gene_type:complete